MSNAKITVGALLAGLIFIFALFIYVKCIDENDATHILVKQSWPTGELSCVDHPGMFWSGFSTIYRYERARTFYFNSSTEKVKGKAWEGDDTDEDNVKVTLSRNAKAEIAGVIKYQIPTNCDELIRLHTDWHSDDKVKHDLVRNATVAAVKKTAPVFTAEEAKVTKIAEFRRLVEDQLVEGEYMTVTEDRDEKVTDDEFSPDGKLIKKGEVQKYTVTKLKLDTLGQRIIIKPSNLTKYGIKILTCDVQDVTLDQKTQAQLDIIRDREMKRVENATKAETAKQAAITANEEGKARVAAEKAEQEVAKIRAVVQAEKEKEVAELEAKKEFEVAKFAALTAQEEAKKIKAQGEAEAAANRAKVLAGLTPQEKAEWEYKTRVGIAEAIAKSSQPIVPEIMMVGGDSKNGGSTTAMDAVGLNMLMDITQKMAK